MVANRKVSSGFGVCLTLLKQGMLKRSGNKLNNSLYIILFIAFRFRNMHIDISSFSCIFIERPMNLFLKPFRTGELSEDYFLKYYYPDNYGDEQDEEVQRTGIAKLLFNNVLFSYFHFYLLLLYVT